MTRKYHFISGLPRSGSTLLAAILNQNPRYSASISSPVAALTQGLLEQTSATGEFYSMFDEERRKALLLNVFEGYYYDQPQDKTIFDTNRLWTSRLHQLQALFRSIKVICCVRDPVYIMDSFERIYRKQEFTYSKIYSPASRQNVYTRCDAIASGTGPFGAAWASLKEAYYGENSKNLLIIDYESLCKNPASALRMLYDFLEEPHYDHSFNGLRYEQAEFDRNLGTAGLHTVEREVRFQPRRSILPPDMQQKYRKMAFWQDMSGTEASIIKARSK